MLLAPFAEIYDSLNGKDWSGRRIDLDTLSQQIQYVFHDYPSDMPLSQKYFFITESQMIGYVYLMNPDSYIFNSQFYTRLDNNQMYLYNMALSNFYDNASNNHFYDLKFAYFSDWENYQETLDNYNLEIVNTTEINTNISSFTLIELRAKNTFNQQ